MCKITEVNDSTLYKKYQLTIELHLSVKYIIDAVPIALVSGLLRAHCEPVVVHLLPYILVCSIQNLLVLYLYFLLCPMILEAVI